ncbi:100 kDa protein [Aviadenovirus phalacrocoracidae]|uniref:Shutoff protein n=1 Tax=Aviadenovirus sp. TaxID=2217649 RepID=A0ABZ0T2N8_9ADEN|nr:100 kDa protein [Aviadenovirus sp.]
MVEDGQWTKFVITLTEHCLDRYNVELPVNFGMVGVEKACEILLELLGEQKAILSVYNVEESLAGEESSDTYSDDAESDDCDGLDGIAELPPDDEDGAAVTRREDLEREEEEDRVSLIVNDGRSEGENSDVEERGEETDMDVCDEVDGRGDVVATPGSSNPIPTLTVFTKSSPGLSTDTPLPSPSFDGQRSHSGTSSQSQDENLSASDLAGGDESGNRISKNGGRITPTNVAEEPETDSSTDHVDGRLCERTAVESARYREPNFKTHLRRQAMLLTGALKEAYSAGESLPATVDALQLQLERFIFNPRKETPAEHLEVRYNFYPPFMTPKAICNYHIFAVTAPIPKSCKANRGGTALLSKLRQCDQYPRLPKWRLGVKIDDGLGSEVSPVSELKDEIKLVPLVDDVSRLQWAKMRGEHVVFFSYPSLHMPPKISRMLMETLLQPFADENNRAEDVEPCVTDEELRHIIDPLGEMNAEDAMRAILKRRSMVTMAVRYCSQLELMERVFREPSSVKKCQEVLHHTFHHGYVQVIRETAKVNLSNYATFHGITYNNPLNNCVLTRLLEGVDKEDFVVDSVYLFLVLTWQTAMGMWQQAVADETIVAYSKAFSAAKRSLYAMTSVTDISKAIVDLLMDGDRLTVEMRKALPNFTTSSQISQFRHFLMERSNVPSVAAPFMPSDFVPIAYKQGQPLLWDQIYLLQMAYYLTNHGGYLWEPEVDTPQERYYCPCNLCSPHRMPQHNVALHNEMLAIGTFEIRTCENKSFKLTPELWTNAYLEKFCSADFHPFTVRHYKHCERAFSEPLTACVTQRPEILSLIRQIQQNREEFLLNKGKGIYKDPATGETISVCPQPPPRQAGSKEGKALPASGSDRYSGIEASIGAVGAIRASGRNNEPKHGSKDVGREDQSGRVAESDRGECFSSTVRRRERGRRRRRISRKSGHRNGERNGGGGILGRSPTPAEICAASEIDSRIESETGSRERSV